ncbi:hypothetical protein UlMin_021028 [Ulmus minor]
MEVLNSSPFTSKFLSKTWNKKTHFNYNISTSKFYRNSSSSSCLPLSNSRNFIVFSHFGRATSRRNSLRKKLGEEQKVRDIPSPSNPVSGIEPLIPDLGDRLNSDNVKEGDSRNWVVDENVAKETVLKEPRSKHIGESVFFNKLGNWVEQYKRDTEYWGIGSGQIFTVFQDSDGNVKRVSINEDEILRRSGTEKQELESLPEVKVKILQAESLAREMESGKNVISRNSSVAKFVVQGEESGFLKGIQGFRPRPELVKELPRFGTMVLYGIVALWALKKLFTSGKKEENYTESEKEMMRRKIKSRKEKEMLEKGSVEVVHKPVEPELVSLDKPRLDKQELMNSIARAKSVKGSLALPDSSNGTAAKSASLDAKIQEIRKMAREARDIEGRENNSDQRDKVENQTTKESFKESEESEEENGMRFQTKFLNGDIQQNQGGDDSGVLHDETFAGDGNNHASGNSPLEVLEVEQFTTQELEDKKSLMHLTGDATSGESHESGGSSVKVKPWIIRSVKEAREYLSGKSNKQEPDQESQFEAVLESSSLSELQSERFNNKGKEELLIDEKEFPSAISDGTSNSSSVTNASNDSADFVAVTDGSSEAHQEKEVDFQKQQSSLGIDGNDRNAEKGTSVEEDNWIEKNFNEHVVEKIGAGFRDNYKVARENKNQQPDRVPSMMELESIGDGNELEWMEDDHLSEIVFRVRENELAGRDPFYMMDSEDKRAFFNGLEKKVEIENEKLLKLHDWLHSNIENLDYGADGISVYDPPEKIIPRWKGPPLEKSPEFFNEFLEQRKAIFAENAGIMNPLKKDEQSILQKSMESQTLENNATSAITDPKKKPNRDKESSKVIIESSDGSVRAGKKSGKEFWQHTKKWSRGFLESYNAESDPEVKSIMKDMGKDLDRWITEKEIQEAAEYMDKLPERGKEFMEKKLNRLKREMELYGPQAVVSKYSEYSEGKEEDYLWWLDLPHVLCIELYTVDDGEQRIGFYSLEMAGDLELEPKPYHVIAFEDINDCKNLCYIIQAQMEMLGNGQAFVVARPPKDAFREAKANSFNVTVIRKGELQLNVDETLEEAEEKIIEIGSKMYHDMLMKERSVDISSIMKGVFGFKGRPTKRKRSKRKLKKHGKK